MNVKELLYDNVRGRVRQIIWINVISEFEKKTDFVNEEEQIKFLYKRTKEEYNKYESLLKEMEADSKFDWVKISSERKEKEKYGKEKQDTPRNSGSPTPKRSRGRPKRRYDDNTGKV